MSKAEQTRAKEYQGYVKSGPSCGNCRHFLSDFVPIKWVVELNEEFAAKGRPPAYDVTLPANTVEKNMRCGIGGFPVKKTAYRNHWERKEQ